MNRENAPVFRVSRWMLIFSTATFAIITASPLVWMVSASLKEPGEIFNSSLIPQHPTLENFRYVFTQLPFVRYILASLPVAVNPAGAFNCYWEMPFRKSARITLENLSADPVPGFYYQITYALTEVPEDRAYLHAQWRRTNPIPYQEVHTIIDGIHGQGQYVGTYLASGVRNNGWWGEGEIKFYLDGDVEWPTICGTGTEDYFCGAWNFEHPRGEYGVFSTPYSGLPQVIKPDGLYQSQQRFGRSE